MTNTPDYMGEVAGVRIWRVAPNLLSQHMGLLWGPGAREPWPTGKAHHAKCGLERHGHTYTDHDPPGEACGCGLYAFHNPALAVEGGYWPTSEPSRQLYNRLVAGVLAASGTIALHEWGFKAEKGRVAALFTIGAPDEELPLPREIIADAYNVPVIEAGDYFDFCEQEGLVVFSPEDL
jgi:hypothetical protein